VKHTVIIHTFISPLDVYISPLKPQFVYIIFKDSVRTAKKTLHLTVTKINLLTQFKEIIAVCSGNHTKEIESEDILLRQMGRIVTISVLNG
jgi:hypothetical protein